MSRHSYIVVPADKAKELAEKTLARVKECRAREVKSYLSSRAQKINRRWYRRLLRLSPVTIEQVEAHERQDPPLWSTLWEIETLYWMSTEDLAEKVLRAVNTGEPFHFSLDDFALISRDG